MKGKGKYRRIGGDHKTLAKVELGFKAVLMSDATYTTERMIVEQDSTDHIFFKCPKCGTDLVFIKIEVDSWHSANSLKSTTAFRFTLICPECGDLYYRKAYQPSRFADPETIEEALFRHGLKKGWIGTIWKDARKIVVSNRYSKSALEFVGLTRELFRKFDRIWKEHKKMLEFGEETPNTK